MQPDHIAPGVELKGDYMEMPMFIVANNVDLGKGVILRPFTNLYNCKIGDDTRIGAFTEVGGATVGRRCKIGAHVFIPPGVTIEDDVFIGPGVVFTNDKYPRSSGDWNCLCTKVCSGASIGAGVVLLPGVIVGRNAMVGAGSLVLRDVAENETYINKRA